MATTVGIIGGGQLAWLLCRAATNLPDIRTLVFAPHCLPKVVQSADAVIEAPYDDHRSVEQFSKQCDVVTVETEALPRALLTTIDAHARLYPGLSSVLIAQDRWREKSLFKQLGLPTNRVQPISCEADLMACIDEIGFPMIIKTRTSGYDGKGQTVLADAGRCHQWLQQSPVLDACVVESWVPYTQEISVVAVRSRAGKILYYPICVNCHRQGILRQTYCQPQHSLTAQARNIVAVLAKHLDYVGVLTVECFVTSTNQLLINEIAPRVHNSGHWTIEGTSCSQFDNHLRAVSGMALGETDMVNYCEMFNLIGQLPTPIIHANAHWYDYGKSPRPGRKLGHVTISGKDERLRAAIISEIIIST